MNESKNKFMQGLSNHVGLSVGHVPKCGLSASSSFNFLMEKQFKKLMQVY
jgi:hypothetical protein